MARKKNPLDKLVGAATGALKDPVGTAGKAVGQAKETAAIGRMVAGQVGRAAFSKATEAAGAVTSRVPGVPGRSSADAPRADAPPVEKPEPEAAPVAKKAPARKSAKKTAKKTTKKTAKKATAKKTAKKAPAKKAPSKKAAVTAPAMAAKKAAEEPPAERPLTAQQVADVEDGPDVTTPVGTTAADVATNPDTAETDLQQPGTEPLIDPGTASAIRSESETLRAAAESSAETSSSGESSSEPGQPNS